MDDEDITAQGVDPAGVHHCILGKHIASLFIQLCVCLHDFLLCGCSGTFGKFARAEENFGRAFSQDAYLCQIQPDVFSVVCAVRRRVPASPDGLVAELGGRWGRSHGDRQQRVLNQGILALFQDHRVRRCLEPRGDARRAGRQVDLVQF